MKIVTVAQMVQIEQASDAVGHSYDAMMELAGRAVARLPSAPHGTVGDDRTPCWFWSGRATTAATDWWPPAICAQWDSDRSVNVYCWKRQPGDDTNYDAVHRLGIPIVHAEEDPEFAQLSPSCRTPT